MIKKIIFYLFYSYDECLKFNPNNPNLWHNKANAFYDLK